MDLSDAYANAAHIPGGEAFPARWAAEAEAFRAAHPSEEVAYGAGVRETLDLFRPQGQARGLAVVLHGGYWMKFSGRDFSHLAGGALRRGWAVAVPTYPLAPEARLHAITQAAARAVDRAAGLVPGPVALAGHSAGGHLALRLACTDVALACRGRLARVVAVSSLASLVPLLRTGFNATLRLDLAEALAESPILRPRPPMPVTAWVGADERPAFQLQAEWLSRAWGADLVVEPGRHHFDVVEGLARSDGALAALLAP